MQWARVASVSLRCKTAKLRTKERLSSYINIYTSVYMYVYVYMCVCICHLDWSSLFLDRKSPESRIIYDTIITHCKCKLCCGCGIWFACVCVCGFNCFVCLPKINTCLACATRWKPLPVERLARHPHRFLPGSLLKSSWECVAHSQLEHATHAYQQHQHHEQQ